LKLFGPLDEMFERVADSQFFVDSKGRVVFFPWGKYTKGSILKDSNQKDKVFSFIINYYRLPLLLLFLMQFWIRSFISLMVIFGIIIIVWLLIYYIVLKIVLRNLKHYEENYYKLKALDQQHSFNP
jgi:hypothetical protein